MDASAQILRAVWTVRDSTSRNVSAALSCSRYLPYEGGVRPVAKIVVSQRDLGGDTS